MRLAFLSLTLASVAWAQTPGPAAAIQIVSDEDQVLVGRTLQLQAIVRDAQGRVRAGDNVIWSVDNRAIAEVGAGNGEVRPVGLGIVIVSATLGGVRADTPVQTMPREVRIEPREAQLEIGKDLQFRATALDANGNPIPVTFAWSVANKNGGGTSLATVTAGGMVRGVFEGGVTVRATYTYNRTVFGMQRQWLVSSPVDVSVPRGYELIKMGRNRMRSSYELRARPSMLWGNDNGDLYFNASLGGLANGLLYMGSEGFKLVGAGGQARFTSGSFATDYRIHSIAENGRILTLEATNGAGLQVNWGDKNGVVPFVANTAPLAGTENGNNFFLTRNSYTSSGWVLVRASYRVPGSNPVVNAVGLFRGYGDRLTELLVSSLDTIPGLPGVIGIDGDFGITDNGVAYYALSQGANRILFRHQSEREKVVGTNDAALNSTVRSFLSGGGNRPTFFVSERGDLLYGVTLNNNEQHFVRWPAGSASPQTLRVNSQSGFLWHSTAGDSLIYANPVGSRGNGIHVWAKDGAMRPVAIFGQTTIAGGQGIQDCESGFLHSNGDASLMMRLSVSNMMIARFFAAGGDPWVMLQHGEQVPVEAPINLLNFVGGARVGNVHLMTGGESGSVTQAAGDDYMPIVPIGSRFFTTQMWFGGSTNNSNFNMRKSPTGDIYFTNGIGIGRVRAGTTEPELFLRTPFALPGGAAGQNINAPFWVDANSRGEVLWVASTGAGDNRMYVTSPDGQSHRLVLTYSAATTTATVIDGKTVTGIDSYTIDDSGRVMMNVRFRNDLDPTAYLWDNGRFTFLAQANQSMIGGKPIAGVTNIFRAGGSRLFAQFSIVGGNQILCEWVGGAWKIVLDNTERLVHGQVINSVNAFDVNRNGDLLFLHSNGTPYLMVRKADGKQLMVMNQFKPTPSGEYIIRFINVDFRDDGTVYFLGVNSDDEQVLYMARPLQ